VPVANAVGIGREPGAVHRRYPSTVICALSAVALIFMCSAASAAKVYQDLDSASITAYLAKRYRGTRYRSYFSAINVLVGCAVTATFPLQLTPAALVIHTCAGPDLT
jgi:hypothetical protein